MLLLLPLHLLLQNSHHQHNSHSGYHDERDGRHHRRNNCRSTGGNMFSVNRSRSGNSNRSNDNGGGGDTTPECRGLDGGLSHLRLTAVGLMISANTTNLRKSFSKEQLLASLCHAFSKADETLLRLTITCQVSAHSLFSAHCRPARCA